MNQVATITVYTKPSCVRCNATYRALDAKGLDYEIRDLSQAPDALAHVKSLGYLQAPVVIMGGGALGGVPPRQDRRAHRACTMTTTTAPAPIIERHHVSWETCNFMREEIARLQAEKAQLQAGVAHWERETNHWYMRANYTDLELQVMYRRRSRGADVSSGEWLATPKTTAALAHPRKRFGATMPKPRPYCCVTDRHTRSR